MNGIAYFLPGLPAPHENVLVETGLRDILGQRDDGKTAVGAFQYTDAGPTDLEDNPMAGVLFVAGGDDLPDDAQEWYPSKSEDGEILYWFGFDPAVPPPAASLQRAETVPGKRIRLGDGNEWLIPNARMTPRRRGLSKAGDAIDVILPGYQNFCDMAEEVWAQFDRVARVKAVEMDHPEIRELQGEDQEARIRELLPGVPEQITIGRQDEILSAALGVNYRLGMSQVLALGLLDDSCEPEMLRTIVDLDGMMDLSRMPLSDGNDEDDSELAVKKNSGDNE